MRFLSAVVAVALLIGCALAGAAEPLANGALEIRGAELTLFADGTVDDAYQVLNVGESALVRTCYGPIDEPCGSVAAGDPRTAGLRVVAELSGPELPSPSEIATVPGGTFVLPGFQQAGEYLLYNIRLVESSTGRLISHGRPSVAVLRVEEILLTTATVTALSLDELSDLGVTLDGDNLQGFNFALGLLFAGEEIQLEMPVLFEGDDLVELLDEPHVDLGNVGDDELIDLIERWTPPTVVPFQLRSDDLQLLSAYDRGVLELSFPLVGAIVLPGSVTFLNQFFEARLIVANGAPAGSGAVLDGIEATIELPSGDVLRLAETAPPQAAGGAVPVLGPDLDATLDPGGQGGAVWVLEGLRPGTHVVRMDISGELVRPGRDPLPLAGAAQAAVEVSDPRFHLTFGHPDVVREGSPYTLFVTVTNLSRATQNLVTVAIDEQHVTGAHKADPEDDFERTIETILPGAAETVEFPLVADVTGRIFASRFEADSPVGSGSVQLYTGVGELGIPLSPASLRLPRFSDRLLPADLATDDLYRWNMRLLGLAYSLAVAPPAAVPRGLPRVVTSDVVRRASDLAQAGRRLFLGDDALASLEVLLLDQLGNRVPLEEYDELRRATDVGLAAGHALGLEIAAQSDGLGLSRAELVDHFATTTGYRSPFLAAFAVPAGSVPPPTVEVVATSAGGDSTRLAGLFGTDDVRREVPFGELYELPDPAADASGQLAVVAVLSETTGYDLVLRAGPDEPAAARIEVVLPAAEGGFRVVDLGEVGLPAGGAAGVALWPDVPAAGEGGFVLFDLTTGDPLPGAAVPADAPAATTPFSLIGARQDFGASGSGGDRGRFGNAVAYLFNRPVDEDLLAPEGFAFWSRFEGHPADDDTEWMTLESVTHADAAFVQDGGRVVIVRYERPLPALVDPATSAPLLELEHRLEPSYLADLAGWHLSGTVPPPRIEDDPLHVGGLVAGRVVDGTGVGVPGARVELLRRTLELPPQYRYLVGTSTTDTDGSFHFEFVEEPHQDGTVEPGFVLRATVPAGPDPVMQPAQVQEVRSVIRRQNRVARLNIALLGRGTVAGSVVYDDGEPVADAAITAFSTLFDEVRTGATDGAGGFAIAGVPVGPITVAATDDEGRSGYSTVGISGPGTTTTTEVVIQRHGGGDVGIGTVRVRVTALPADDPEGEPEPVGGAPVALYGQGQPPRESRTNTLGWAQFNDVPAGQVTVQAASWEIAQAPVVADAILVADSVLDLELVLATAELRDVSGQVVVLDPVTLEPLPAAGVAVFISGPGVFSYTDEQGTYRLEGVPTQRSGDLPYLVSAISFELELEGSTTLPPVLTVSPPEIQATPIELVSRSGGISGLVLDAYGSPVADARLVVSWEHQPYLEGATGAGGTFRFDDLPLGRWGVVAHDGDGLQPGSVGNFGEVEDVSIAFGGHIPHRTIQFVGSGIIRVHVSTGDQTPVFIRPTCYRHDLKSIGRAPVATELQTDPNGIAELEVPVGLVEVTAMDYFGSGAVVSETAQIEWPGQVKVVTLEFGDTATVAGRVVDVDGVTPVAGAVVELWTRSIEPQQQTTDALGGFQFFMVPEGGVRLVVRAAVGAVERTGSAVAAGYAGGETVDVTVRLEAMGSVRGRVVRWDGSGYDPVAHAHVRLTEGDFPFQRHPAHDTWIFADADGRYQVSGVHEGPFHVVARDPDQVHLQGSGGGRLDYDWHVAEVPDIVLSDLIGRLEILVRDPDTGAPLPDSVVSISGGGVSESTVAGQTGVAAFEALRLGGYSVYAFHAPTGRGGRLGYVALVDPGATVRRTLDVSVSGEVSGTLWDDADRTLPMVGWHVDLAGATAMGPMTATAITSGAAESLGRFRFGGIPAGDFQLRAGHGSSPRRAAAEVSLTPTAPLVDVDLVLEAENDVFVRLYERLTSGLTEIDPASGSFSVRLTQLAGSGPVYDFTSVAPLQPSPGHLFALPSALWDRSAILRANEWSGEQRSRMVSFPSLAAGAGIDGTGTAADPFQVVLNPKGIVTVAVLDSGGAPVPGAEVTVSSSGGARYETVADDGGAATFVGVPAGAVTAIANAPFIASGGRADGILEFDDQVLELTVDLAPKVSARGVVYQPTPDDVPPSDPSQLIPASGALVTIHDSDGFGQQRLTDDEGGYRFDALAIGAIEIDFQDVDGVQIATLAGVLDGPNGTVHELPGVVLDAFPPRVLGIVPPPGMTDVSLSAGVEIAFSEPIPERFLPAAVPTSQYFELTRPHTPNDGPGEEPVPAVGSWTTEWDQLGRPVVRFTPAGLLANNTTYSIGVRAGAGGITDRVGRLLSEFPQIGSTFTTADTEGPVVLATVPSLEVPFDPTGTIRFDFNEGLVATDEQLDGDGDGDAGSMLWGRDDGAGGWEWRPLPVSLVMTRSGYSMLMDPDDGFDLMGDTLARRVDVGGLQDVHGNAMEPTTFLFRIRDANPPVLDAVPPPAGAVDSELTAGVAYTLAPQVSGVDHLPYDPPEGDIARVDYFLADPGSDPGGQASPVFSADASPWTYTFVPTYSQGDGQPQELTMWARASDTSTNQSNVVQTTMWVLPNAPPTIATVSVAATRPVAGTPYAGSELTVTVSGVEDPDGAALTISAELRLVLDGAVVGAAAATAVQRPTSGSWADLGPVELPLAIPLDIAEQTSLVVVVRAVDSHGAAVEASSSPFGVADDATPPSLTELVVRRASDGQAIDRAVIGESFVVELRAADLETALSGIRVAVDRTDLFPDPIGVEPIAGVPDHFRSSALTVPAELVTEPAAVVLTVEADDVGGNTAASAVSVEVAPSDDPTDPVVELLTPWSGGAWPAGYVSVTGTGATALLLRAWVDDPDENGTSGQGGIYGVEFRGPVIVDGTTVQLAGTPAAGALVAGTQDGATGEYQAVWPVPDGIPLGTAIPFEVRAVDTGNNATVRHVELTAVASRRVYEGVSTAVVPGDAILAPGGAPTGAVFVLDGSVVSLYPDDVAQNRALDSLFLYAGGEVAAGDVQVHATRLTVPEVGGASSIDYYPFELTVASRLGIGRATRIDVDGLGLQSDGGAVGVTIDGEVPSEPLAGASHGGRGWGGRLGTYWWEDGLLSNPGTTYGSLRLPSKPGAAGGGSTSGAVGAAGGGVVRIDAGTAVVSLAGTISADGANAVSGGGGAGGSILLSAATLRGRGELSADGGASGLVYGPGGGGRVAVYLATADPGLDLAAIAHARGGVRPDIAPSVGGAGTVFMAVGDGGPGVVRVSNRNMAPGGATPLAALRDAELVAVDPTALSVDLVAPARTGSAIGEELLLIGDDGPSLRFAVVDQGADGDALQLSVDAAAAELEVLADRLAGGESFVGRLVSRFAEVVVANQARLSVSDDLEIVLGDGATVAVNDRSAVELVEGGRVRLAGEEVTTVVAATPPPGAEIPVGGRIEIELSAADVLGVFEIERQWQADPTADHVERLPDQPLSVEGRSIVLTVPPASPAGPVELGLGVSAVDGRTATSSLSWTVRENGLPAVVLGLPSGVEPIVGAGESIPVVVTATDAEALASVGVVAQGPATQPSWSFGGVSGQAWTTTIAVTADPAAAGGQPIVLTARVTDSAGVTVEAAPLQVDVTADATPPEVTVELTPEQPDDLYHSGDDVLVRVTASDDIGLAEFTVSFDGVAASPTDGVFELAWVAPRVSEATVFPIIVAAADAGGNSTPVSRLLTVEPSDDTEPPTVTPVCPLDGDSVVADQVWTLRATVSDDHRLETVWATVDGAVVGEETDVDANVLDAAIAWQIPSAAAAGTTFEIGLHARDYGGNVTTEVLSVSIPMAPVVTGELELDPTFSGSHLVLGPGTYVATAPLELASLELLAGATLTSPRGVPLEVVVAGTARVACDAAIDVSRKGYAGGTSYPGAYPATTQWVGPSHIGMGSILANVTPPEPYGSITRPVELGASGQLPHTEPGGGAVHLVAASLELAGTTSAVRANGTEGRIQTWNWEAHSPGAGGSIWIEVLGELSGDGVASAGGGSFTATNSIGAAGGGAIAVEFGSSSGTLLEHFSASGGVGQVFDAAPGSVFLRGPGATFGDLIVDGAGARQVTSTVLTGLGFGRAAEGSGGAVLVVDREPPPAYFVGHWVEIRDGTSDEVEGVWRIASIDGTTVTLVDDGLAAAVDEGDRWLGRYRFDSLTVRGGARLELRDSGEIGAETVEPGSELIRANLDVPQIDPENVSIAATDHQFRVSGLNGAVDDLDGIASAAILNPATGGRWPITVVEGGAFAAVVVVGAAGDELELEATDGHPQPTTSTVGIGALPINDGPPSIDAGLLEVSVEGGTTVRVRGSVEDVMDPNGPVAGTFRNATTGSTVDLAFAPDGTFDRTRTGSCDDVFELTLTDAHPQPLTSVVDLGTVIGDQPPVVYADRISVRASGGTYWVGGSGTVVVDACGLTTGFLEAAGQSPATVDVDLVGYGFPSVAVPWPSGTELVLVVEDAHGKTARSDPATVLPPNDGPPAFDLNYIEAGGRQVRGSAGCIDFAEPAKATVYGDGAIITFDGLSDVVIENRTTPGFEPVDVAYEVGSSCFSTYYRFPWTTVDGAIGDQLYLVATDFHPEPLTGEVLVLTLSALPQAPQIYTSRLGYSDQPDGLHLYGTYSAVTDPDGPITVEARCWRADGDEWLEISTATTSITTGSVFDVLLPGARDGDLVVVSATDATGATNRVRTTVEASSVAIQLVSDTYSIREDDGRVQLAVRAVGELTGPVMVRATTEGGSAAEGVDFQGVDTTISFAPGDTIDWVTVNVLDDSASEGDETFTFTLSNPLGAALGAPFRTTVTIVDDETAASRTVAYSVLPGGGELLSESVPVDVAAGVAHFGAPLVGPDRGDLLDLGGGSVLLLGTCSDSVTCAVTAPDGSLPQDVVGGAVGAARAAFGSLAAAIAGADTLLHTSDLAASHTALELLCYAGAPDTEPVTVTGWTTSPETPLTIVAPTGGDLLSGRQRHQGRWTDQAYRLVVTGQGCLVVDGVDDVVIEGLQLACSADPDFYVSGIDLSGAAGRVVVGETLIRLDAAVASADRIGIVLGSSADVMIRNNVIWDLGDDWNTDHIGISALWPISELQLLNNTVIGGNYGIQVYSGALAVNNLVAGANGACFDGPFAPDSRRNLASDGTAPNPPAHHSGPVTVTDPVSGPSADFHLGCGVMDQDLVVRPPDSNFDGDIYQVFDGDPRTVINSGANSPAMVQVEFSSPRVVTGTEVKFSNCNRHWWTLEAADSVADLEGATGSYQLLVDRRELFNVERGWDAVGFGDPVAASVFRLTATRECGDHIHLAEWELTGLNPACGAGLTLSGAADQPGIDIDSAVRVGAWDIGADQSRDLAVSLVQLPHGAAWEAEGEAVFEVVLSDYSAHEVRVEYATRDDGSAVAGEDFIPVSGRVSFAPGEVYKQIRVAVVDDGAGEGDERFYVDLSNATYARIGNATAWVDIKDGTPPVRSGFAVSSTIVSEGDAVVPFNIVLSAPLAFSSSQGFESRDATARVNLDFETANGGAYVLAGDTVSAESLIVVIDDTEPELDESFFVELGWPGGGVEKGYPSRMYVRILDDDLRRVAFESASAEVDEGSGSTTVRVVALDELTEPVTVDVVIAGGTAAEGADYELVTTQVQLTSMEPSADIELIVVDDGELEGDETVQLTLSVAADTQLGEPSTLSLTIHDDEHLPRVYFYWPPGGLETIDENGGQLELGVGLWDDIAASLEVTLVVVPGGTATLGADFAIEPQTVTFVPGSDMIEYAVLTAIDDSLPEDTEQVTVTLESAGVEVVEPSSLTIEILDDDESESDIFIDPAHVRVDLTTCHPTLMGDEQALLGTAQALHALGYVWNSDSDWYFGNVDMAIGEPFSVVLEQVDLGSGIDLEVYSEEWDAFWYTEVPSDPPALDLALVSVETDGASATVTIPEAALTYRLETVILEVRNAVTGDLITLPDPCEDHQPSVGTIAADAAAEAELRACHGIASTACTDWSSPVAKRAISAAPHRNGDER